MERKYILVVNAGSATLKFKVFNFADLKLVREGIVERIGLRNSFIEIGKRKEFKPVKNHEQAFSLVISKLNDLKKNIVLVSHRVVHGGEEFTKPILITQNVLHRLKAYNKLAPLHNPVNLSCIAASMRYLKNVPDAAVFDTAFFSTLPRYAFIYALPLKYYKRDKIRRYGFHGISHEYVAMEAAKKIKKPLNKQNLITCHLGSGCSITAIKNGKAIDTSMGFTPLEGLVMSTRSGSIDPAIPLYLIRNLKMKENEVNNLLNKKSGLFGLSGFSDMREILKRKEKPISKLTLDIFIYNIKKYVGAYAAILGKVDAIVFTAGIGERSPLIRKLIAQGLPKYRTLVIPTNEELMIAKKTKNLINK